MPRFKPDWHPADVKAALEKAGITQTALARANGYQISAPGKAMRKSWPAVERIIAAAIGLHPKEIWPSRYTARGRPLREGRWPDSTTGRHRGHVESSHAA